MGNTKSNLIRGTSLMVITPPIKTFKNDIKLMENRYNPICQRKIRSGGLFNIVVLLWIDTVHVAYY